AQALREPAWRAGAAEHRAFLEGPVQLGAARHLPTRRVATRSAVNLLAQALITLEDSRPAAHGIDVEALVADFTAYLEWLKAIDRPHRLLDRLRIPRLR